MQIHSAALLGAGAVGSYIIWGLADNSGVRFGLMADGARRERLQADGVTINGRNYHPAVWGPDDMQPVDLIIVALKYNALPGSLDLLAKAVGPNTIVMSLMNGVDSEEIIGKRIGMQHMLYSLIKIASHKEADGFHFDPAPEKTVGIIFGEGQAPYDSERVSAVMDLFAGTGIRIRATEYAREEEWSKFRLNICNNLPQAELGVGVGCYRDSIHMEAIREGLRREVEAIAQAKGIDLKKVAATAKGSAVPPYSRYSTLQDLDAGRHTEIDMFSGAIMRMGEELGIPTPFNTYTYHFIKALEEKNDGLFDYSPDDQTLVKAW